MSRQGQDYPTESESRALFVELGRRLYQRGFVAANDGNISVRLSPDWILATPTGVSKGFMSVDQMVLVNLVNGEWKGILKPSTEIRMHRAIYLARHDVRAVVHAHPPIATAFSVAGIPLDQSILAEVIVSIGTIPIAEYHTPSTQEFADHVAYCIQKYEAILLANHGAVTVGKDLEQAFFRMETLEHYAHISWIVRQLGSENVLSFNQVRELMALRSMYGLQPPAPDCLTCPNYQKPTEERQNEETVSASQESSSLNKQTIETIVRAVLRQLETS
ncbi:class II aldolase/adducin family protein [candidate division CSSED10-310 bacterium]|uniref:Class II aldolase/adducin family protein n=1 Tax=candidate division CSSED10-310 bacterium TaxID=2855610 RepID=A0ABV6YU58_UNCC1